MKILLIFLFIVSTCGVVLADECRTNIKSTDSYQELNIILNCLSRKIVNLENEIANLKKIDNASAGNLEQNSLILDNKYLSIYGIKAFKDDVKIYITFTIKSKNDTNINVCVGDVSKITISDDSGRINTLPNNSSYMTGISGTCSSTLISPGQFIKVGLTFDKLNGDIITLSLPMNCVYDIENRKSISFSVSVENIKISGS